MTSLVAYASSDDEESTSENEETNESTSSTSVIKLKPSPATASSSTKLPDHPTSNKAADLIGGYEDDIVEDEFKKLPGAITAENLPKPKPKPVGPANRPAGPANRPAGPAVRKPVKIAAITMTNFDSDDSDDDEPSSKKMKKSSKGCGLTAILPAPKHTTIKETKRALIPHTLTKKPAAPAAAAAAAVRKPVKKHPAKTSSNLISLKSGVADESDEETEETIDFFSLDKRSFDPQQSAINLPPPTVVMTNPKPSLNTDYNNMNVNQTAASVSTAAVTVDTGCYSNEGINDRYEQQSDPQHSLEDVDRFIQDEEFIKFAGKKFSSKEDIAIIDVHADSQMSRVEVMKSLSEETDMRSHSQRNKGMPSGQHRRKHQITYLAFQAKEREIELKNQWAQNRMNKRTAQSKYGF
ncbi:proline-rich protein PRCC-like [Tubulanus polymorphus]|uniref:proline-rich protein PRCC-like n=1 Tax=Tubulanus polymorphus TaxID=672921 RepID=UPI003DA3CCC7